jgi:hypothetical protein
MLSDPSQGAGSAIWVGKPWVLPSALAESVLVIVMAVVVSWLEFYLGIASLSVVNVQAVVWTGLTFFLVWMAAVARLLSLRASNLYTLRSESLEVRSGILTSKTFVFTPSGFSDLEVITSVLGRILGYGDIIIRVQSENERRMILVRKPSRAADQIRRVMSRPTVRIERPETYYTDKQTTKNNQ